MSKLKIEHGASRVNLVLLKTNIEETIAQDIDLMATWSDNDRRYIVNELLRFALTQEEDFQKYKASVSSSPAKPVAGVKPGASSVRSTADASSKPGSSTSAPA